MTGMGNRRCRGQERKGNKPLVTLVSWALLSGQLGPSTTAPSPLTSHGKALLGLFSIPNRVARHAAQQSGPQSLGSGPSQSKVATRAV